MENLGKNEIKEIVENGEYYKYVEFVKPLIKKGIHLLIEKYHIDGITSEKIAEDSMIKSIMKIDKFDETKGKFTNWLFKIMINSAVDQHRKGMINMVSLEKELEEGHQIILSCVDDPLENEQEEKPGLVNTVEFDLAFSELSYNDKQIIGLLLEKYSNEESAAKLGIKNSIYRKRKERALKRFKNVLVSYPCFKDLVA